METVFSESENKRIMAPIYEAIERSYSDEYKAARAKYNAAHDARRAFEKSTDAELARLTWIEKHAEVDFEAIGDNDEKKYTQEYLKARDE